MKDNTFLFRAHPWHGVPIGDSHPDVVNAYIEIVPSDTVKYELDKASGILKIDRPQKYSNHCPSLYGFIPQTLCANRVAAKCMQASGKKNIVGDNDPMDICVLTERNLPRGDILLKARPIGGLRMIDKNQADDKILAVLPDDAMYGHLCELSTCPQGWIDRLKHYFLTYKQMPDESERTVEIEAVYDAGFARELIVQSHMDYKDSFL